MALHNTISLIVKNLKQIQEIKTLSISSFLRYNLTAVTIATCCLATTPLRNLRLSYVRSTTYAMGFNLYYLLRIDLICNLTVLRYKICRHSTTLKSPGTSGGLPGNW